MLAFCLFVFFSFLCFCRFSLFFMLITLVSIRTGWYQFIFMQHHMKIFKGASQQSPSCNNVVCWHKHDEAMQPGVKSRLNKPPCRPWTCTFIQPLFIVRNSLWGRHLRSPRGQSSLPWTNQGRCSPAGFSICFYMS